MEDNVVNVNHLSKDFKLPHERTTSIKSVAVNFYKRNKSFEHQHALKDVSFAIKKGEFFGIVGRNGSGKSTLLKILAGIYVPTKGEVEVRGKLTPFIELGVGFNPELTGRENIFLKGYLLGFNRKEMRSMYKDIVEFAELERFMDQKLKNYSSGMQVRLAFSIATRAQSDILLVDEVLAVGDADFQKKCFDYFRTLKKNNKTVVFVSHDMGAVREFCDRGILIEGGTIKMNGSSKDIAKEYAKLFMEGYTSTPTTGPAKRLGNGHAKIEKVSAVLEDNELRLTVAVKAYEPLEELIYGLHIVGPDGVEVTSMNNRMLNKKDVTNLEAGDRIEFQWKMQNVFAEGRYTILLTLVDGAYTQLDYYEEAAHFNVERDEKSNTNVLPSVSVSYKSV